MGPSEKAFQQVKSILGKLDRSIDQLREARATPPSGVPVLGPTSAAPNPAALGPTSTNPTPQRAPDAAPATPARRSQYGRATPLPPTT